MDIWQLLYTAIPDMKNYSICYQYNWRQVYLYGQTSSKPGQRDWAGYEELAMGLKPIRNG